MNSRFLCKIGSFSDLGWQFFIWQNQFFYFSIYHHNLNKWKKKEKKRSRHLDRQVVFLYSRQVDLYKNDLFCLKEKTLLISLSFDILMDTMDKEVSNNWSFIFFSFIYIYKLILIFVISVNIYCFYFRLTTLLLMV